MPIEFAYAQARALSRHGDRLSSSDWRALEASRTLGRFLQAVRATVLAPCVDGLSESSTPHDIERVLRTRWRDEVDRAARWVAGSWRGAVRWTAGLAELDAISYLRHGGEVLPWMHDDPVLATVAAVATHAPAEDSGRAPALAAATGGDLPAVWLEDWRAQWPQDRGAAAGMRALADLVGSHRRAGFGIASPAAGSTDPFERLGRGAVRLMRAYAQQPAAIFCHLLLTALELRRLRDALLRRALGSEASEEPRQ